MKFSKFSQTRLYIQIISLMKFTKHVRKNTNSLTEILYRGGRNMHRGKKKRKKAMAHFLLIH